MLYPITPIFLTSVLGASMFSVGLIEGFAEAVASLLKTYSGKWSDRIQKRVPFIWAGYFLSALAKPMIGLAGNWTHVLVARGLDRTGKGLRGSPRDALLAESVSKEYRGAAFGWHRAMDTLGAAIGPLLTIAFLTNNPSELRPLYFWAFIPGIIAVSLVYTIREKGVSPSHSQVAPKSWPLSSASKNFKIYLLSLGIFSITNSSDVFLLLKAKQSGLSLTTTILYYCFYNLTYALLSPYLGHLSDRLGRKLILSFGFLVFAFVYLGFSQATQPLHYWLLFGIYGIYMAATDGVGKAFAVDLVPKEFKATGIGIVGTVTGIATVIASSTAGLLWDKFGSAFPFYYGASGALIAIVALFFVTL